MEGRTVSAAVIGGGVGGIEAARKLGELKVSPLLVVLSEERLGGRSLFEELALRFLLQEVGERLRFCQGENPREYQVLYKELIRSRDVFCKEWQSYWKSQLALHGVEVVYGEAFFESFYTFSVGGVHYTAEKLILATGTKEVKPAFLEGDADRWWEWEDLPKSVAIVGSLPQAYEVAYFFAVLGVKVFLVEEGGYIFPSEDSFVREIGERILTQAGVVILKGRNVKRALKGVSGWSIVTVDNWGKEETLELERFVVYGEREPHSPIELRKGENRWVAVDSSYQTSVAGVFAIGGMKGQRSASAAKREGILAAENLFLQMMPPLVSSIHLHKDTIDYTLIPEMFFFDYPLVRIGITVDEARVRFKPYEFQVVRRKFASGLLGSAQGEVEVVLIIHKVSQTILGMVAYGRGVESLVSVVAVAMSLRVGLHRLGEVVYTLGTLEDFLGYIALEI